MRGTGSETRFDYPSTPLCLSVHPSNDLNGWTVYLRHVLQVAFKWLLVDSGHFSDVNGLRQREKDRGSNVCEISRRIISDSMEKETQGRSLSSENNRQSMNSVACFQLILILPVIVCPSGLWWNLNAMVWKLQMVHNVCDDNAGNIYIMSELCDFVYNCPGLM